MALHHPDPDAQGREERLARYEARVAAGRCPFTGEEPAAERSVEWLGQFLSDAAREELPDVALATWAETVAEEG